MNRYIWTLWTGAWEKPQPWDLLCYAVSVGFVRRFCPNVEIYTDEQGARLLDDYCIEGDRKVLSYDIRPSAYPRFAEAKMITLASQDRPFCHIDHDVFLVKEQADNLDADIVVQSPEETSTHHQHYISGYYQAPASVYPEELNQCAAEDDFKGYNCGYVRVHNLESCKEWCDAALKIASLYDPSRKEHNAVLEQMSLYALAKHRGLKVSCLFTDEQLSQLGPETAGYVHLMGAKETDRSYITARLIQRAKEVAPEFYRKCFDSLPQNENGVISTE
jgi:hypothetical protein